MVRYLWERKGEKNGKGKEICGWVWVILGNGKGSECGGVRVCKRKMGRGRRSVGSGKEIVM